MDGVFQRMEPAADGLFFWSREPWNSCRKVLLLGKITYIRTYVSLKKRFLVWLLGMDDVKRLFLSNGKCPHPWKYLGIFKALKDHENATDSRPKQSWKNYPVVKALYLARGNPQWKGMSFMWRDVTSILLCIEDFHFGACLNLLTVWKSSSLFCYPQPLFTFMILHGIHCQPVGMGRTYMIILTSYVIFIVCHQNWNRQVVLHPISPHAHLRIDRQMKCTTKMKAKLGKSNQLTCIEIAFVWQENMCWIRKNPYCLPFLPQSCRLKTTLISRTLILEGPILHFMIVEGRVFTSLAIHLKLSICWRVNWCWGGMFFWCGDSN